jgi:hypothetical protein
LFLLENLEENLNVLREGEIWFCWRPHNHICGNGEKYDIIDFELGVKLLVQGFPVYKGKEHDYNAPWSIISWTKYRCQLQWSATHGKRLQLMERTIAR